MAMTINKRLDDLENRTGGKRGHAVLYADPDRPGEYTERSPWGKDPGRRYTEGQRQALEAQVGNLVIVEYVKNWRSDNAD